MGIPDPIYPLSGHCSVIYNNTLYVYSPAGFQSLSLTEGAKWQNLPMDVSLTGAQCVKAVPGGDANSAMLYIVGGTVNSTAATWDYPGLMHYSFSQKKWDWVRPESFVTQNRLNHAATYIDSPPSILVYSGSQSGDTGPSSSTFLISTVAPFGISSSPSNSAPPTVNPLLLSWDSSNAVMFGGGASNTAVFLFNATNGWQNLGVTLTEPITNQRAVQFTLVTGSDGSKVLEKYDMSISPNTVSQIALLNQGGTVAAPGTTVGGNSKRLAISTWPAYNATGAPNATRTGFSLAQDDNGEVAVVTGGNAQDPLCIFSQKNNAWVNATELFDGTQVIIQSTPSASVSSTALSTLASTATASASSTAAAAPVATPVNNKTRMLTVLGATLGAIFGIAALLILLLFCLKYRKAKNKKAQQSGYIEKDRLSFADRGAEFMKEAGGSAGNNYAAMNASQSSLAIMSGKANHNRGLGSDASTAGLIKKSSPLGYAEPLEMAKFDMKPEPLVEEKMVRQNSGRQPPRAAANVGRSRSSGWSRYFANNEATNLAHMPSGRSTYASERTSTGSQSLYTDSRMYSQPSQTVPPLEIPRFDGQRISRVPTGSPTLGNSQENLPAQPMQAELGRANSNGSARSGISDDFYHHKPTETWTPVDDDNRASSNYTNSVALDTFVNRDGASSYYADGTSSFYPKSITSSFYPGQPKIGSAEDRDSTVTTFPNGTGSYYKGNNNTSTFPPPPPLGGSQERESTVTVFPGGNEAPRGAKPANDMSWLNLGGAGK